MRRPDEEFCPFELEVTQHEHDALEWLVKTCEKIALNPKSCNKVKAALATRVIAKMRGQLNNNHVMLHDLEVKVTTQAAELASLDLIVEISKETSKDGLN